MKQIIARVPCCCRVTFSASELSFASSLAHRIAAQKILEGHHKTDHNKELERWTTGLLGEMAVQNALNLDFMDYNVGVSGDFDKPDLHTAGYNIGVKTSCYPNFPVINRKVEHPEIFVILNSDKTQAVVAGLASVELLKKNAENGFNEQYVKIKAMLDRKNAFIDLDKLEIIKTKDDLGWKL